VKASEALWAEVGSGLSSRAAEVELREAGPVAEGAVDGPGGSERGGIVGGGAGWDGGVHGADGAVAPRGVGGVDGGGRAEAAGGHAEWGEDLRAHEVFPGEAGGAFEGGAYENVARVGVEVVADGNLGGEGEHLADEGAALFDEGAGAGPEGVPDGGAGEEVADDAAAVLEELLQGDVTVGRAHGGGLVGEGLGEGGVPAEGASLDEARDEGGGHGLGVGPEVPAVVDGDGGVGLVGGAEAHGALREGAVGVVDRGREGGERVPCADGFEGRGEVGRGRGGGDVG